MTTKRDLTLLVVLRFISSRFIYISDSSPLAVSWRGGGFYLGDIWVWNLNYIHTLEQELSLTVREDQKTKGVGDAYVLGTLLMARLARTALIARLGGICTLG